MKQTIFLLVIASIMTVFIAWAAISKSIEARALKSQNSALKTDVKNLVSLIDEGSLSKNMELYNAARKVALIEAVTCYEKGSNTAISVPCSPGESILWHDAPAHIQASIDALLSASRDKATNDIIEQCQKQGYFTYNGLTFSCEQMFVVEE